MSSPCLSLYQPTHRRYPDNQQDPIRFRNLVRTLDQSLRERYPDREVLPLLAPFGALADDHEFWRHTFDGLCVFASQGDFRVRRLQRRVPELAIVADTFHTKPLLRIEQSADRYQVLGLNRHAIRLFEGNRDVLDEIEPAPGVPRTLTEALGDDVTEPHTSVASYRAGAGTGANRYGQGSKKDEVDSDTERFFRAVDRAILERHSQPSRLPLLLAALPQHHALFRRVSHNPFLLPESLDVHPDALTPDELRRRAWAAVEPRYLARLGRLIDEFHAARARGQGADDLADVAAAAAAGRVATLLVEADRCEPGRLDRTTGRIERAELRQPDVDDLLDDLAELVADRKGDVIVVPGDRMPATSGAAAIFRF